MYHYIGRVRRWGANDFWESGAARPDLVLSDLIHVMHPELLPDHDLVYYRRLR
jgi:iron complex transport system substrate-binding protein